MARGERCECETCRGADKPCTIWPKSTDCQDNRAAEDWCQGCREDLSDEWEARKREDEEAAKDREFDERCALGYT